METTQVSRSESKVFHKVWGPDEFVGSRVAAYKRENTLFTGILIAFEIFLWVIYGVWLTYGTDPANPQASALGVNLYYPYFRDVSIMIFFGFGFLMTFLRKYAYSALGYTFLFSCLAIQWALPLRGFFEMVAEGEFHHHYRVDVLGLLDALFCAGAVMITYGGILGRSTPLQMLVITIIEPILFFLNLMIGKKLGAFDVGGGMYIHLYGAYFGLAIAFFLTYKSTKDHSANGATYMSDQLAMAGTFFLWIMWPSFNAAIAPQGDPQLRAIINTFLSLVGSVLATFLASRLTSEFKFEMVHVQNASLAGGVVMGVMAHCDITILGAMASGFIVGTVSVLGYVYLTPKLTRMGLQDTCGIHNLHGMPGFIGSIGAVFASVLAVNHPERYGEEEYAELFPAGEHQPARQAACVFAVLAIALAGGTITGFIVKYLDRYATGMLYFEDTQFWVMPHAGDHGGDPFAHEHDEEQADSLSPYTPAIALTDLGDDKSKRMSVDIVDDVRVSL
eukprot:TRINITY_DN903_c0_g1_i1.p1 TRINITY_DN903_c0_g1~~TRINITY_DN903_c0_g1_i1.p1  ORF type:complete len:504 (-),score=106.55 TRINITY_DN903_c0_g1_i1:59-1570(-)